MSFQLDHSRAIEPMFYRAPCPPEKTPMEFQLAGVEYALARDNCLIGDDMGLGKSMQAILLSNAMGAEYNLVVCPASLRLNWEREVWMWSMLENVTTYPVLKSKDGVSIKHNYVIVSYNMLSNPSILNAIMDVRWDHLILDEAHALKDPAGNKRTQVICAPDLLPSVVGRITMLSGTILPNQPIECYNACRLLNWGAIDRMSLEEFRSEYYTMGTGYIRGPYEALDKATGEMVRKTGLHFSDKVRNVPVNLRDLQQRLRKNIMVRRLKTQVLKQLPKKQWHMFPLSPDTGIRKALKHPGWKEVEKLYDLGSTSFNRSIPIDGAISTARRLMGEAKVKGVVSYIEQLLEEGAHKLVVGAWHRSVLQVLRQSLSKYGLVYMDGNTTPNAKQIAVDKFQGEDEVRIILGQSMCLGEGWTLTAAQDVVFAEFDWVPGKNDQLLDRINRMGQKGNRTIGHVPVVPDTLEERIMASVVEKARNIHETLDAED
jgi:SWI/SNF-related matrix-associated actin-dependent regulator of chromatin subfamily A-like protein 1